MVVRPSGFLLDTNVVSELMKPRPSRRVADWVESTPEELLYLSVITIGEVRKGINLLDDNDPKRAALLSWLDRDLRVRFAGRLLTFDDAVAERWGHARGAGEEAAADAPDNRRAACSDRASSRPDLCYEKHGRHRAHGSARVQPMERWREIERECPGQDARRAGQIRPWLDAALDPLSDLPARDFRSYCA